MYRWSLIFFLIFLTSLFSAIYLDVEADMTVWLMITALISLFLTMGLHLVGKMRSDIKFLKRSWRLDKQYRREREAEKGLLVSSDKAKKRYRKARFRHMFFSSPNDEDLNGYIGDDDPDLSP